MLQALKAVENSGMLFARDFQVQTSGKSTRASFERKKIAHVELQRTIRPLI
jgi:hypothetical protein